MDPFSALSIATAVIQFLDFARGLLKAHSQLRKNPEFLRDDAFDKASRDLISLKETLQKRPRLATEPDSLLKEHEQVCLVYGNPRLSKSNKTNPRRRQSTIWLTDAAILRTNLSRLSPS